MSFMAKKAIFFNFLTLTKRNETGARIKQISLEFYQTVHIIAESARAILAEDRFLSCGSRNFR